MTTGWTVRFRGRLSPGEDGSTSHLLSILLDSVGLEAGVSLSEHYGVEPSFGDQMIFAGVPFGSVSGVSVVGTTLEFGAYGTNLAWPLLDEDDDGYRADYRRIDAVLDFLSDYTVGDVGEVHGVVGFEHHDMPYGWPILRCTDGRCRIALTPCSDPASAFRPGAASELIKVPRLIPREFAGPPTEDGNEFSLDLGALRSRLLASGTSAL
jgi:hypothetical protein